MMFATAPTHIMASSMLEMGINVYKNMCIETHQCNRFCGCNMIMMAAKEAVPLTAGLTKQVKLMNDTWYVMSFELTKKPPHGSSVRMVYLLLLVGLLWELSWIISSYNVSCLSTHFPSSLEPPRCPQEDLMTALSHSVMPATTPW